MEVSQKVFGKDRKENNSITIVINVKNKGIVILIGRGHAGVINTINYAKKITRVDKIYALIGGFHLQQMMESMKKP
jgi:7,8-dihydropterin-6-yl-methyl-4-(beta-D-ribofuranosyl)aminobenzene 5'-phosphate synthase